MLSRMLSVCMVDKKTRSVSDGLIEMMQEILDNMNESQREPYLLLISL